jgi:hypothetical protein
MFSKERARAYAILKIGLEPILGTKVEKEFPRAFAHFSKLRKHPAFAPDVEPYLKKLESHKQSETVDAARPASA